MNNNAKLVHLNSLKGFEIIQTHLKEQSIGFIQFQLDELLKRVVTALRSIATESFIQLKLQSSELPSLVLGSPGVMEYIILALGILSMRHQEQRNVYLKIKGRAFTKNINDEQTNFLALTILSKFRKKPLYNEELKKIQSWQPKLKYNLA